MAKRRVPANKSMIEVSASVAKLKAEFQDIIKLVEKLSKEGKSAKEIYDAQAESIEEQLKLLEKESAQLEKIKKSLKDKVESDKLDSKQRADMTKALNKAVSLEKQLGTIKKNVQNAMIAAFQEEQAQYRNLVELGEKELSQMKEGLDAVNRASEIKSIENRIKEEGLAITEREKNEQQQLRDQIKEGNARRTEEVKAFESRRAEFARKRKARLKELGQLEKKQEQDRIAAAKTQLEIDLKILNRGKMTLEQRRDAQAKLIRGFRSNYDQQSNDYKRLTLRLIKLDESFEKQIADRDRAREKGSKDFAKNEAQRQKKLSAAGIKVFKLETELSKKSAKDKLNDVEKYYASALRNTSIFSGRESAEYKELYADLLALRKKYNKQIESEDKKNATAPSDTAKAAPKRKGFLEGVREGFRGGDIGKAVGRLTGVGSVVAVLRKSFQALTTAITGSFKAAVDYEAQLAQLQAVTGVTNKELKDLSNSVLQVAGSTTFTSEQIVELQTELGKLGFSSEEIIAATKGIAATAQALGEQVGPVAQKVGQILKQYNLDASETEKISDTLVSTINSSALSFEGFSTALQYIGPLAAEVGTEFEETAAAMAVLADNGFTASRIGTGLRGILTELSSSGEDLASVIRKLADRNLSFSEAIELVGKRNAAQLITLVDNIDALEQAEDKYYQAGSAAIASAQQIDTYKGNLQLLNSALNKVSISFGNLIKNSKILKLALRLVDEEGYNAALASEQLAEANRTNYSKALESSAEYLATIANQGTDVTDKLGFYTKVIIKRSIIDPLMAEADALREERDRISSEMYAAGATQEAVARNKRYKEIKDRLSEIREITGTTVSANVNLTETYERLAEAIGVTKDQLIELIKQERIDLKREEVSKEFTKDLKERIAIREKGFTDLKTASNFELENRAKVASFDAKIEAAKQEAVGLTGDQLLLQEAVVNQLEKEQQNYVNLLYTKEELFGFAQKEYELEFKTLSNKIQEEKQSLSNKQKLLDIEIKTLQNKIEGTKDEKKKKELIAKQVELQNQQLENQEASYAAISEYINEQYDELEETRDLWKQLGYDTRILDKAFARLEDIRLGVTELAIDFPELADKAKELASSFQKQFGDQLKKGKPLTAEQMDFVTKSIDTLINDYGGMLSEEEKQALRDNLLSTLLPDIDKDDIEKKIKKFIDDIFGKIVDAAKEYNATALENTTNRLKAEIDLIKNRYKIEEEILKSQLNNQLITENQFRTKQKELRRAQIAEENSINKQIFEAQKKSDLNIVAAETTEALFSNILNNYEKYDFGTAGIMAILATAAVAAAGAAKADAIRRRKFYPVKFEEGGMVEGPSHAQGGVPFTVQGRGGYEMEGGEFIVNKKAASLHRGLLEKINNSYKVPSMPSQYKFASGGLVGGKTDESVDYLKAIAEATVSTAINSSKPVRAFVSAKDLRQNENERRLRDRNDRV